MKLKLKNSPTPNKEVVQLLFVELIRINRDFLELNMFKTYHCIDKALKVGGWELADKLVPQRKR